VVKVYVSVSFSSHGNDFLNHNFSIVLCVLNVAIML